MHRHEKENSIDPMAHHSDKKFCSAYGLVHFSRLVTSQSFDIHVFSTYFGEAVLIYRVDFEVLEYNPHPSLEQETRQRNKERKHFSLQ